MAIKVFLDENILLDLTLRRKGYETAKNIFQIALEDKIQLFTSPFVLQIAAYYTTKEYGSAQAKNMLLTLLNDVEVIDSDHSTVLLALGSAMADTEDSIQYYTALKFKLDYFISSDKILKKDAIPQLPVCTAQEFIEKLG